jgi:predicted nucleotidyltransferase
MDRTRLIALLRQHAPVLAQRFGAREVALFGSAARDELRSDSDVDILVGFDRPPTFDTYFGTKDYLESVLGRPVDLVTPAGLKPRARQHVERDLVRVA